MTRSILKKALPSSSSVSQEDHNRNLALYHANALQERKDAEAWVLASTEALVDFPRSPSSDPAHPSLQDVLAAKDLLKPFQPSDYDALVTERNIDKKCGYIFCPRPNRLQSTNARYRILQDRSKGRPIPHVVPKESLECWCSDSCGKRALFVKVQLSEEPIWTRTTDSHTGNNTLNFWEGENLSADQSGDRLAPNMLALRLEDSNDNITTQLKGLVIGKGEE